MFGKVNLILKNPVGKGAANICLIDTVTESGLAELNITVQHISILPQTVQLTQQDVGNATVANPAARTAT
jgi:hypothetical protein